MSRAGAKGALWGEAWACRSAGKKEGQVLRLLCRRGSWAEAGRGALIQSVGSEGGAGTEHGGGHGPEETLALNAAASSSASPIASPPPSEE